MIEQKINFIRISLIIITIFFNHIIAANAQTITTKELPLIEENQSVIEKEMTNEEWNEIFNHPVFKDINEEEARDIINDFEQNNPIKNEINIRNSGDTKSKSLAKKINEQDAKSDENLYDGEINKNNQQFSFSDNKENQLNQDDSQALKINPKQENINSEQILTENIEQKPSSQINSSSNLNNNENQISSEQVLVDKLSKQNIDLNKLSISKNPSFLEQVTVISLLLGTIILIMLGYIYSLISKQKTKLRNFKGLEKQKQKIEKLLYQNEAIIDSDDSAIIVWKNRSDTSPRLMGSIKNMEDFPPDIINILDFRKWIGIDDAKKLEMLYEELQVNGVSFNQTIKTNINQVLDVYGRTIGTQIILKFQKPSITTSQVSQINNEKEKLAEEVLSYRGLLDNIPFPVWKKNNDGKINWGNKAYSTIFDDEETEAILAGNFEAIDKDKFISSYNKLQHQPGYDDNIKQLHQKLGNSDHEINIVEKADNDGYTFFAYDSLENIDANKITEHDTDFKKKKLNSKLIKNNLKILEHFNIALACFNENQELEFYNEHFAAFWDLSENWLRKKPNHGDILDKLNSKGLLPIESNYRDQKKELLSSYDKAANKLVETEWFLPDSRSVNVTTYPNPSGGIIQLYNDISDKLEIQSKVSELDKIQKETFDHIDEGLAVFGSDGKLKFTNSSFINIFGFNQSKNTQISSMNIEGIITHCQEQCGHKEIWDELRNSLFSFGEDKHDFHGEVKCKDDKILSISSVPIPKGKNLLTVRDITSEYNASEFLRGRNEALETAEMIKNLFVQRMSFEFRTPLTTILGFSEQLFKEEYGNLNKVQKEYLEAIQSASNTLRGLIDQILDLAKIDSGTMSLEISEVDLYSLLQSSAVQFSDKLKEASIDIKIDCDENIGFMLADLSRMQQIISNLLSNAIIASKAGSMVEVGIDKNIDEYIIWVRDHGDGIKPGHMQHIFNRFESFESANYKRGSGLGLAIVKSFVELQGGTIEIISEIGKGTTILCKFPFNDE